MFGKRLHNVCAGLLSLSAICLSPQTGQCQTTVDFVSDATWNTFAMNPDGSQGVSLGLSQCINFGGYSLDLSSIPGSCWMWMPGVDGNSPADLQGAYFTKHFDIAGTPIDGSIRLAVDDFAEVIVNGASVGSSGSISDYNAALTAQGSLKTFDVTPYLVVGPNTITVKAQNGPSSYTGGACSVCKYSQNHADLVFGGSLRFDATTPLRHASWSDLKARYR
jgi:hypothetical protein